MAIIFKSAPEIARELAERVKELRLNQNLSQKSLAERSGVRYGTLKKFEQTGQVSLENLIKLAIILDSLQGFEQLFTLTVAPKSIKDITNVKKRQRGRE